MVMSLRSGEARRWWWLSLSRRRSVIKRSWGLPARTLSRGLSQSSSGSNEAPGTGSGGSSRGLGAEPQIPPQQHLHPTTEPGYLGITSQDQQTLSSSWLKSQCRRSIGIPSYCEPPVTGPLPRYPSTGLTISFLLATGSCSPSRW